MHSHIALSGLRGAIIKYPIMKCRKSVKMFLVRSTVFPVENSYNVYVPLCLTSRLLADVLVSSTAYKLTLILYCSCFMTSVVHV